MEKTMNLKRLLGDKDIVFFGWDRLDAGMNMAIGEVLMKHAREENRFFLRFYDFSRPSVVLGAYSKPDVLKDRNAVGVDFSRRITGGWTIYMDDNMVGYDLAGPLLKNRSVNQIVDPVSVKYLAETHKFLGPLLAEAVSKVIGNNHEIRLDAIAGVKVDGGYIASHAQRIENQSFLYHGVVVVAPWNVAFMDRILRLSDTDKRSITGLPNLTELADDKLHRWDYKDKLVRAFVSELPKENLNFATDPERNVIFDEAKKLYKEKYSSSRWILSAMGTLLRDDDGFCILYDGERRPAKKDYSE